MYSECDGGNHTFSFMHCVVMYFSCRFFMKKLAVENLRDSWRVWYLYWKALVQILCCRSVWRHSLIALFFCSSIYLMLNIHYCLIWHCVFFRYDNVLFVALQALRSLSNPDLTVYHTALRELCGNLYYLVSQYLYLHGHVLERASDVITCSRSFVV